MTKISQKGSWSKKRLKISKIYYPRYSVISIIIFNPLPMNQFDSQVYLWMLLKRRRFSDYFKVDMWGFLKGFIYHILKSVFPNIMQRVLSNTILKKCPSEHEVVIKLELKENCSSPTLPTSSKTYPYPKCEHNGAVGSKYANYWNESNISSCWRFRKWLFS